MQKIRQLLENPHNALVAIGLVFLLLTGANKTWTKAPINNDVNGYYSYLPATFIYGDSHYNYFYDTTFRQQYAAHVSPYRPTVFFYYNYANGTSINKYPLGMAVLLSPFFAAAHLYATATGSMPLGYSLPYQIAVVIAAWVYAMLGLFYLQRLLRIYFTGFAVSLTLFTIALCSNYLFYVTIMPGMSHIFSFTLFSGLLLNTVKWYNTARAKYLYAAAVCAGLVILVRPLNGLFLLVPLLWNIANEADVKARFHFLLGNLGRLVVSAVIAVLVVSLQLVYFKYTTGSWYQNLYSQEGFYWDKPMILQGLLSFRNGWLVYSPAMVTVFIGLFAVHRYVRGALLPLISYALIAFYFFFAWWCWYYGGSLGMRVLIESTALFSICIATFYTLLFKYRYSSYFFAAFIGICFLLNVFQSMQYVKGLIDSEGMTAKAYLYTFGKTSLTTEQRSVFKSKLSPPDYLHRGYGHEKPVYFNHPLNNE